MEIALEKRTGVRKPGDALVLGIDHAPVEGQLRRHGRQGKIGCGHGWRRGRPKLQAGLSYRVEIGAPVELWDAIEEIDDADKLAHETFSSLLGIVAVLQ